MNTPMNIDELVGALRNCSNPATRKPDCDNCPLFGERLCVKKMLEGAADLIESQAAKIAELNDFQNSQCAELLEKLGKAERRERAHEAAIKRHYGDATSQCFLCYSCVNHDARGHWNGKGPYACSGCGKSHPNWRFDEGRFAQEGTK